MNSWLQKLTPASVFSLWFAILFLAAAALPGYTQTTNRQIGLGEVRQFRSTILNENREIQIALPETYNRTAISYPVLFLLDGSSHLLHASATVRFLAAARNRIPEMIIIALPNTNRNRDMTPGPGAATFERVLAEEIIPWVEKNFRAAPERVVFGHSLSASFAAHAMLNRPELFDAYIITSAPVWRYEGFDADLKAGLVRAAKAGTSLYLTVGELENKQLREGMRKFSATLKSAGRGTAPAWSYVDMKDEDHSSTPQRSLYNALEARYTRWRFPFFEELAELDQAGGLKGLEAHYQSVSSSLGFTSPPPEARLRQVARIYMTSKRHDEVIQLASTYAARYPDMAENLVNQIGYDLLKENQVDRALQAFKRNTEMFPSSTNVFDSLGDGYCRAGDQAKARETFQQAARVAENQSPSHPRLASYQEKALKGCSPAP